MCFAGITGGVGLNLALSPIQPALRHPRSLLMCLLLGGVSALPFGSWLALYDVNHYSDSKPEELALRTAVTIWQTAMGTYLYVVTNDSQEIYLPQHRK